ncbi:MAG: hypothetical protein AABY22_23985 [Nanoarchaeota archaeon]
MEEKETISGNKLLAEAMKLNKHIAVSLLNTTITGYEFNCTLHSLHELKYHKSWDWLHTVIDKIESIGEGDFNSKENYHVIIEKRYTRIIYDWDKWMSKNPEDVVSEDVSKDYRHSLFDYDKKLSTWQAVVDFFEWYTKIKNVTK